VSVTDENWTQKVKDAVAENFMNSSSKAKNRQLLSPLEKEILWTLREAGEENLSALLNIIEPLVPLPPGTEFLPAYERAIKNLLRLKFIEICIEQREYSRRNLVPLADELDLNQAVQRMSNGQWGQSPSADKQGTIVVMQLVDHGARSGDELY